MHVPFNLWRGKKLLHYPSLLRLGVLPNFLKNIFINSTRMNKSFRNESFILLSFICQRSLKEASSYLICRDKKRAFRGIMCLLPKHPSQPANLSLFIFSAVLPKFSPKRSRASSLWSHLRGKHWRPPNQTCRLAGWQTAVCLKPHRKKNCICSLESSPCCAKASQPYQKTAMWQFYSLQPACTRTC